MGKKLYAEVLLPLPVKGFFNYSIPENLADQVEKWKRVVVQFGSRKIYTAIVVDIKTSQPEGIKTKPIISVFDDYPVMNSFQFDFWLWISQYYMCTPGEVMNVAFPSSLKLSSETNVLIHPEFTGDISQLTKNEQITAEALTIRSKLSLSELMDITGQVKIMPLIKNLLEKKVILVEEEIKNAYKPKKVSYVELSENFADNSKLQVLFNELEKKAFKQLEVLMQYIRLADYSEGKNIAPVRKSAITETVKNAQSPVTALISKGIFKSSEKIVSRLEAISNQFSPDSIELTKEQQNAKILIQEGFKTNGVVLLHGITSSGKTEIYIKLINEVINSGKQVLYLLPEIALTTQIINRLRKYFGEEVGIYHSRYNANERREIWERTLKKDKAAKEYKIILGPRSALFLPYSNLGLIIVDEEHDHSFKQYDPAPRYNARDAAIYLATFHKAKVLLGSATPAIESYFNAKTGKYQLVELFKRYSDIQLPEVWIADLKKETREKKMQSHFSSMLIENIEKAIGNKEQVILFQNRRGFSLRLECEQCNWMPACKNCDVTLIYHKFENKLKCHYCGFSTRVPGHCVSCGSSQIKMKGFGTEKVEEELAIIFPNIRIRRMDLDTTRSKNAYHSIISDFESRKIDILVGTQMVTKGLDFDNVSVVGILNADNMITFPDFRSYERSFQLMVQVSGRAGRKKKRGTVIIQTFNPQYSVIRNIVENDFTGMYKSQILERRNFKYPPFYRLIQLKMKHRDKKLLDEAASALAQKLRNHFDKLILGPEYPIISRINNLYIKNILIKLERKQGAPERKQLILETIKEFQKGFKFKSVRVIIDVDPV
ncbi:MAG: primosomal protein N' [Bacteroidales bacterium]|nr:primosomal protein N' [Bacteroidales bacterium]